MEKPGDQTERLLAEGETGQEGVKKLATARGCCGFGNTDKLQA